MNTAMYVFSDTNIGLTRKENQDRVRTAVLADDAVFAVICDGMGGENAGSEASERAVEVIYDRITKVFRRDYDENSVRNLLISAVTTANAVVYDVAWSDENMTGMGTTCVIALKIADKVHVVNVGDSRAYRVGEKIELITKDHTVVMRMYENGEISFEDMKNHPQKNYITKAVGVKEMITPDYFVVEADENTSVVLCSDGLTNNCSEENILKIVSSASPEDVPSSLIKIALENGGNDNVTVAVIK